MFLKLLVLALASGSVSYYVIAFLLGFVMLPIAGVGALSARGAKVGFLLPFAYAIVCVGVVYILATWAAYCCKMAQYCVPYFSGWLDYPIGLLTLLAPIRKLTIAERKASGQSTNPWLYVALLIVAYVLFSLFAKLMIAPITWLASFVLPLAFSANIITLAIVSFIIWLVLTIMFRGTDSPDPVENPIGNALSENVNRVIANTYDDKSEMNTSDISDGRMSKADRFSVADESGEHPSLEEIITITGGALREAADMMVAEGIVATRAEVSGDAAAEYLQGYYKAKMEETENEILSSPEYRGDIIQVGGYYLEAFTRESGSCEFEEWLERMQEDIPLDVSDEFWQKIFTMTKDDFIRRVCLDDPEETGE